MRLRFAEFTLDTDSRQLYRGDAERHLSLKAYDLLCLLVENRPRALSRAELHERLWPSTFVSEATLTSVVAEVREALGEHAKAARFVRTVHRFGYAFQGDAGDVVGRAERTPQNVRCWIIWEFGQAALSEGTHLLGRDSDVAIRLECPTISRHHARVRVTAAEVTIEDLGSRNGTLLRGVPLSAPIPLVDGDEIRLGSVPVKVRIVGPGSSTETVTQDQSVVASVPPASPQHGRLHRARYP
jgi:DNA-binding winged helix-turn-helix (wHTH) protein